MFIANRRSAPLSFSTTSSVVYILTPRRAEAMIGDLEELFATKASRYGVKRTNRCYRIHVASVIVHQLTAKAKDLLSLAALWRRIR